MAKPDWKEKHFELLCSIDDLCRKYDIDMFLVGATALHAFRGEGLSDYVAVGINSRDAGRFIEAAEKENLHIRGMFNYGRYNNIDIRVYDPETTDFNLMAYENLGFNALYVTVRLIYNYPEDPKLVSRGARMKRAYAEYIAVKYNKQWRRSHRRLIFYNAVGKVVSEDRFSKILFKKLMKLYGGKTEFVGINGRRFEASLFDDTIDVMIEGRAFRIPSDTEAFFTAAFGMGWKEYEVPEYVEDLDHFRDAERTWEEFVPYISYLDYQDYLDNEEKLSEFAEDYVEFNRQVANNTRIMIRTHLRFVLWQKYYPLKDEIIKLHEAGDHQALTEMLYKYILVLERLEPKKITVCFDPEIFEITLDTLRNIGQERLADSISTMVPPEHNEVIRIKDYRGEYI